jgi:hypothetical protein
MILDLARPITRRGEQTGARPVAATFRGRGLARVSTARHRRVRRTAVEFGMNHDPGVRTMNPARIIRNGAGEGLLLEHDTA